MTGDMDEDPGRTFIKCNRPYRCPGVVEAGASGSGEELHLDRVPIVYA